MSPCRDALVQIGVAALERCADAPEEWTWIDEIGYLETGCAEYTAALQRLLTRKRVLAALRKQDIPFLQALRRREDVFLVDLDQPWGRLGCVVMASGRGTRFGANKLMADFRGEPLIARALEATEGLFARRIVITRYAEVAAWARARGAQALEHDLPHRSDTVRLGLAAMAGEVDGCLFCPADQPLLRRETVAALALSAVNDPQSIWRTAFEGVVGAPVLFPRWAFGALLSLTGKAGGGWVAKSHPERVRTVPVCDSSELMDVDTRADLEVMLGRG